MSAISLMVTLVIAGTVPTMAQGIAPEVEKQLLAAQNLIVDGKLDDGLKTLHETLKQTVPEMAGRVAFIEKLIEVRVADKLGDQTKLATGLTEAVKLATQPDQLQACWQLGLGIAQTSVAEGKPDAVAMLNFLSEKIVPGLEMSRANVALSKLYITVGNPAKAETELIKATAIIKNDDECKLWTTAVTDLAKVVDDGKVSQASIDLYSRLRKAAAPSVQAALDVVQCKALLAAGELLASLEVYERVSASASDNALMVLPLGYELSAAFAKLGDTEAATAVLTLADAFVESLPENFERNVVLVEALKSNGYIGRAADLALESMIAIEEPEQRKKMLTLYASSAVSVDREGELLTNLKSMDAPPLVYAQAALALAKAGKTGPALSLIAVAQTFILDIHTATDVISTMKEIQEQRKKIASSQAASCLAIAAKYTEAVKQATEAKDTAQAEAYTKQAEAFTKLAAEIEK